MNEIGKKYIWDDDIGLWESSSNGTHIVIEEHPCKNLNYDCCDFVTLKDLATGETIRENTEMLH